MVLEGIEVWYIIVFLALLSVSIVVVIVAIVVAIIWLVVFDHGRNVEYNFFELLRQIDDVIILCDEGLSLLIAETVDDDEGMHWVQLVTVAAVLADVRDCWKADELVHEVLRLELLADRKKKRVSERLLLLASR